MRIAFSSRSARRSDYIFPSYGQCKGCICSPFYFHLSAVIAAVRLTIALLGRYRRQIN